MHMVHLWTTAPRLALRLPLTQNSPSHGVRKCTRILNRSIAALFSLHRYSLPSQTDSAKAHPTFEESVALNREHALESMAPSALMTFPFALFLQGVACWKPSTATLPSSNGAAWLNPIALAPTPTQDGLRRGGSYPERDPARPCAQLSGDASMWHWFDCLQSFKVWLSNFCLSF